MNNQSPLIPQGSLLEQRNKGRAKVKIAVFLVLAIHGVGLMALLMQGCKKEPDSTNSTTTASTTTEPTNTPGPAFVEPTNTPAPPSNLATAPSNNVPITAPVEQPAPVTTPPPAAASDYVVTKGDTFSMIAKKFHVSVKSMLEANPSVEPTKLKIGQTIHIPPAPATVAASSSSPTLLASADTNNGKTYTVRSGDSLTKIAGEFGVSVRSLRSANTLKTDKIVVGQKLQIPTKAPSSTSASTGASTTTTSAPISSPTGQ